MLCRRLPPPPEGMHPSAPLRTPPHLPRPVLCTSAPLQPLHTAPHHIASHHTAPHRATPQEYSAWLEGAPITRAFNDAVRAVFVLSYMLVRALYFPYVVWGCYVSDMRAVLLLPLAQRKGQSDGALWLPVFLGTAFSLLQLWWGTLLVKQLRKMMRPPPSAKKTD